MIVIIKEQKKYERAESKIGYMSSPSHKSVQKIEECGSAYRELDCSICLENSHEALFNTDCGHLFHVDCLARWCVYRKTCPICRATINDYPQTGPYPTVPTLLQMEARNLVRDYFDPANPMDNISIVAVAINYLITSN
jgi:hypothetical protein